MLKLLFEVHICEFYLRVVYIAKEGGGKMRNHDMLSLKLMFSMEQ